MATDAPLRTLRGTSGSRLPGGAVMLIRTPSDFHGAAATATEQSTDGCSWQAVSPGIVTTGHYAVVLRNLRSADGDSLDVAADDVGIGPRRGTPLVDYLRGRVHKACATLSEVTRVAGD